MPGPSPCASTTCRPGAARAAPGQVAVIRIPGAHDGQARSLLLGASQPQEATDYLFGADPVIAAKATRARQIEPY
jgi:hypothetical protein